MVEMKAKFKHTWIQVNGSNESGKIYTHVLGMIEVGRSKIEEAMGNFETLIHFLRSTRMIHNPLGFKLGRDWESHVAAHEFQTHQAARRALSEAQGKMPIAR